MEHLHDSIGSNRFVVRLFILVFACNIAFEANAPHMAETFHKEAVRADAIVDFQNLIGQQLHREQFCERMLFDLLCKFHCSVRGVSLIPHCIAAGIGEKRDPFGRKHTFTYLDFRGPEVIDPQCGRHAPLGTPFRYSYFWVIRSKDDDFLATSTVFCVRLHAPAVNRFRFRPGVEITVRAVVTFEFAYFLFIHRFLPSYSLNQILSIHIKIPPNSFGRG